MAWPIAYGEVAAMEIGCRIVEAEAKRVIGTDSIKHNVTREHGAVVGYVSSDLDRAVSQELGTASIPSRSFLMNATIHKGDEAHRAAARLMKAAIDNANRESGEFGEILCIAKEAGNELKDLFNETIPDPSGAHPESRF